MIAFDSGEVSTFDVGWTAGTIVQDLLLLGTTGVIGMDDFVLDWTRGFVFRRVGDSGRLYPSHRHGDARRDRLRRQRRPRLPQEVAMIEDFADLAHHGSPPERAAYADASLKTQEYLDALWAAILGS